MVLLVWYVLFRDLWVNLEPKARGAVRVIPELQDLLDLLEETVPQVLMEHEARLVQLEQGLEYIKCIYCCLNKLEYYPFTTFFLIVKGAPGAAGRDGAQGPGGAPGTNGDAGAPGPKGPKVIG